MLRKNGIIRNWNHRDLTSYRRYCQNSWYDNNRQEIICHFWNDLYRDIEAKCIEKKETLRYNNKILELLNEYKNIEELNQSLYNLQKSIEDITSKFDECSIFHFTPNLIKLL